jgi:hypothetical protein
VRAELLNGTPIDRYRADHPRFRGISECLIVRAADPRRPHIRSLPFLRNHDKTQRNVPRQQNLWVVSGSGSRPIEDDFDRFIGPNPYDLLVTARILLRVRSDRTAGVNVSGAS